MCWPRNELRGFNAKSKLTTKSNCCQISSIFNCTIISCKVKANTLITRDNTKESSNAIEMKKKSLGASEDFIKKIAFIEEFPAEVNLGGGGGFG